MTRILTHIARRLTTTSLFALLAIAPSSYAQVTLHHVGPVSPNVLAIEIHTGERIPAQQQTYDSQMIDWIDDEKDRHRWVRRGREVIGTVVGPKNDVIYGFDQFRTGKITHNWAKDTKNFVLSSTTDSDYRSAQTPLTVYRKSKPIDMARTGFWAFEWPQSHTLYLQLSNSLKDGETYTLSFKNSELGQVEFTHNSRQQRSEAVHVSQVGFRPDDPQKLAFMSAWRGDGGGQPYPERFKFELINTQTGKAEFTGQSQMSRSRFESEDVYEQNYNGTDVLLLDFSAFKGTGDYRVCVINTGCSYSFPIRQNAWKDAFATSARGLYHQRSGIEIREPFSGFKRPRNMHPADNVVVYQSRTPLMNTQNGINALGTATDNFSDLVRGKTNETLDNAWGGYADAGDWDRRIQHLSSTRSMLELLELYPNYFKDLSLNIPESNNKLPDLLDESLWGLDFFRRLQTREGGVRGGIESSDHPRHGEGSWQESQTLLAYAPGVWSSYIYAGVAARAAGILGQYDTLKADMYRESALRAMTWAEAQGHHGSYPFQVRDERNLAAAELFKLTKDPKWNALFKETSMFIRGSTALKKWKEHDQTEAAFVYTLTRHGDPQVRKQVASAIINEANRSISIGDKTAFKWTKRDPWAWLGWGNLTVPSAQSLVRAHFITKQPKYLDAALKASQFGAGANPLNLVYTTGIGQNPVKHPLLQDQRVSGQAAPEGITVNGPLETKRLVGHWLTKLFAPALYPEHSLWPTTEAYFDVYDIPQLNEFTVQSTIGPNAYIWGYLAARK